MNEGLVSARLGLKGIPSEAEEIMAIRDILLARRTGGHVHLCHMSTRGSVELIRWGKDRNIRVTAEVCPHHLSLTEEECEGYDTDAKMNPPLRSADDVDALQQAVKDGTIDVIATDHIGFETALAVNITWLVKPGIISVATLIDKMSCAPAKLFHLPGGSLRKGGAADITVFDPAREWTVEPSRFFTKGRNTPYAGRTLTGLVACTLVDGRIVHTEKG